MIPEKCCSNCMIGDNHARNYEKRKAKQITYLQYLQDEASLGGICIKCIFAPISRKKAKRLAKKKKLSSIPIMSEDCFVPKE